MFFENALAHQYPDFFKEVETSSGEPLATFDYENELKIKNLAFQEFWKANGLDNAPKEIVASPLSRAYRTTSKRRVYMRPGNLQFDKKESLLEPKEHNQIYNFLFNKLIEPSYKPLAYALNWIIIRGSYTYRVVIFNIKKIDASIVRKLKQMAKCLQESPFKITAAHIYVDPSRSDYYLESNRPKDMLSFKQLYGPRELSLKLSDFSLRYPVTGFSQINESQIQNLLFHAKRLLAPSKDYRMLDLYCGYGLFAFGIGKDCKEVIGAEWEGPSVELAKASARYLKRFHYKFISGKIDESFIEKTLPKPLDKELVLLDPPRKGCLPGVIEKIAKRTPERVLHIFCGTDEIPESLCEWENCGYFPKEILPLDLFPGTAHLETMILLEKK